MSEDFERRILMVLKKNRYVDYASLSDADLERYCKRQERKSNTLFVLFLVLTAVCVASAIIVFLATFVHLIQDSRIGTSDDKMVTTGKLVVDAVLWVGALLSWLGCQKYEDPTGNKLSALYERKCRREEIEAIRENTASFEQELEKDWEELERRREQKETSSMCEALAKKYSQQIKIISVAQFVP